jgi:phosphoglycerate dehydrogenase-like enzyme
VPHDVSRGNRNVPEPLPPSEVAPKLRLTNVTVTATLAGSIESNIESLVSRILADYLEHSSEAGSEPVPDELAARRQKIN